MTAQAIKRQSIRLLLLFHFLGLALSMGASIANVVIERNTRGRGLELLSIGRDLISVSSRELVQTGFYMVVISGVLIVVLRYGLRAPAWVWIKLATSAAIFAVAALGQGPTTAALAALAHWSVEHGQLAPQFSDSLVQAGRYGETLLVLFLATIAVAIWKPVSFRIKAKGAKHEQPEELGAT
jgi:hypothetical protein